MNIKTKPEIGVLDSPAHSTPNQTPFAPPIYIPNEADLPVPAVPSELGEAIAFYQHRMQLESQRRRHNAHATLAEAGAYRVQAEETHVIDGHQVNIFAPFTMEFSALKTITRAQIVTIALIGVLLLAAIMVNWEATVAVLLAIVTMFYTGNLLVTFWFSLNTLEKNGDLQIRDEVVTGLTGVDWPAYTILCPLYRETEVVAQFAQAMKGLDYPTSKLQILFLTEADDEETRDAIRAAKLPPHFQIVTVPDGNPRTKPRACNYGLLEATGEFVVIYDAEDIPDPLQLKKAVLAFASHGPDLGCVQAKLNFYNSNQNILTRLFTIEYSTWFDTTLPGLQWGQFSLPLGGTSNHFRMSTLRQVGAWDAFNVTEDCDLGLRLSTRGYHTAVLDSTTYEEANPNVKNWIRQRSRWIKGYMQTYLIHMRRPTQYMKPSRWREFVSLQVIVGGRTAVLIINPIMWGMTILYFVVWPALQQTYDILFPPLLLYAAVICLIFGNLAYIYTHFIGCIKRRQYGLVKWTLLMPLYWAMTSYAAFKAFKQLITNPHYWEKTKHGLHLSHPTMLGESQEPLSAEETQPSETVEDYQDPMPIIEPYMLLTGESNGNGHTANFVTDGWIGYAPENGKAASHGQRALEAPNTIMLAKDRWPKRLYRMLVKDRWLTATILTATLASILATVYFFQQHQILLYSDSYSHLAVSRRVFDSLTPGFAQFGAVWLPLPHLLMMPFTAIEPLWRTGLAGAAVSMPSFIITAVYIFLSARRLTKNSTASFVGTLVFILNPNVLYLQTTPLSEPLAAATITAACYYFIVWLQDNKPISLLPLAIATFLATLSRYDGWAMFACFFLAIGVVSLVRRQSRHLIESNLVFFAALACTGILFWLAWNALIFGDPLFFQRSEFSAQAQQEVIRQGSGLNTYRDVGQSVQVFSLLTLVTLGPAVLALSVIGVGVYLIRKRISLDTLGVLMFLVPIAFYLFSLYSGQIIILVPELGAPDTRETIFNVRYGTIVLPAAALFVGLYLASFSSATIGASRWLGRLPRLSNLQIRTVALAACAIIITGQSVLTSMTGIITLKDGQLGLSCLPQEEITNYLATHYDGGKILVDTFYNNAYTGAWSIWPLANIDMQNMIYEGSNKYWHQAISDPASIVDWIILHPYADGDDVAEQIDVNSPKFRLEYALVLQEANGRSLYRRSDLPAPARRSDSPVIVLDNYRCGN